MTLEVVASDEDMKRASMSKVLSFIRKAPTGTVLKDQAALLRSLSLLTHAITMSAQ